MSEKLTKSQVAERIFEEAEKQHLNLFYYVTKEDFECKNNEILKL